MSDNTRGMAVYIHWHAHWRL